MKDLIRDHIKELDSNVEKIEAKMKKLSDKISDGTASNKDVAQLMELNIEKRECKHAIFNLYQVLGKAKDYS